MVGEIMGEFLMSSGMGASRNVSWVDLMDGVNGVGVVGGGGSVFSSSEMGLR